MLKQLSISTLVLSSLLIIPIAEAVPGPAAGECDVYRHQSVVAIVGVIATGDNEVWGNIPGCGIARSSTQILTFVGEYNGPVFLAAATVTWSSFAFSGCSLSGFITTNNLGVGGSNSVTRATVTMTSNECRGVIQVIVNIAAGYTWVTLFPIDIRVEQPPYLYMCDATGLDADNYSPTTICESPSIRNYICDATITTTEPIPKTECTHMQLYNYICRAKPNNVENVNCDTPSIRNYLCDASDYALVGGDIPPSQCTTPHIAVENLTVNATIMGNVSINQTNLPEQPQQGFDGSLYILVCIMIAVMIHLGQSNKNKGHYAFAGFLSLVAGFVLFWELDRTGFNNLKNGVVLAGIFMFMHVALASYLFYLFATDNQEEPENK